MTSININVLRTGNHDWQSVCKVAPNSIECKTYSNGSGVLANDICREISIVGQSEHQNFFSVINPLFTKDMQGCIKKIMDKFNEFAKNNEILHTLLIGGVYEDTKVAQDGITLACKMADYCEQENIPFSLLCGKYNDKISDNVRCKNNGITLYPMADIPLYPTKKELEEYLSARYKYVEISDIPNISIYDSFEDTRYRSAAEHVN